jgi:dynein heavy chain
VPRLLQDNVKYLGTLEKFLEPLYKMTPVTLVDSLSALFNGIKMVYTVSR